MNNCPITIFSITYFIFGACILYTIGVWGEKLQGRLKAWHLAYSFDYTNDIGCVKMTKIVC